GELGIGLSGPGKNATADATRADGQASLYFRDTLRNDDRLSVAVRTKEGLNSATGTNGLFASDPAQNVYATMGDTSTQQDMAQSSGRLYMRYDHGPSYFMYGDLHGDVPTVG